MPLPEPTNSKTMKKEMGVYRIDFDFTTVTKSGRFTGRSGYLSLETTHTEQELSSESESLQRVCAAYVHEQKPKWNIFILTVKNITKQ